MPFAGSRVLLVLLLVSCASIQGPVTSYETQERVYRADWDEVWDAVLETLTDLDIPIDYIETASGFVRSDDSGLPANGAHVESFDCGSYYGKPIAARSDFDPRVRFTVLLREGSGGTTRVRVRVLVNASVQGDVAVHCVSTGTLEDDFYRQLSRRVDGQG
jgi:hypothetical protein